jgi:tetratricopeptide (TPR) repeat protein
MSTLAASLQQRAIELARAGNFGPEALEANRQLTELAPDNEGAWTRLARCCLELSLYDDATAALETALRLNPQNTIARNLHQEVTRRRVGLTEQIPAPRTRARAPRAGAKAAAGATRPLSASFGRPEFLALGQLPPVTAVEALGARIEVLLMSLNDRPFAAKVVEARNRAAQSGSKLYRRNSFYAGQQGHIYAFHHGGRWEPQINLGWFAAGAWGRDCLRAGIGFNVTPGGADPDREAGQERVIAYFERFQQLVAAAWRQFLTDWMAAQGGFIQYGDKGPALDLLPADAVAWLINSHNVRELGWVFCGRWLFADRAEHADILGDPGKLLRWAEQTFSDLLPLWTSVYRER